MKVYVDHDEGATHSYLILSTCTSTEFTSELKTHAYTRLQTGSRLDEPILKKR